MENMPTMVATSKPGLKDSQAFHALACVTDLNREQKKSGSKREQNWKIFLLVLEKKRE